MRRILIILFYFCTVFALRAQTPIKNDDAASGTYYYDLNGNKIVGIIYKDEGEDWFLFKKDVQSKKERITASMVKSLVCVPDSFIVSRVIDSEGPKFLKVLVNEDIKLYEYDRLKSLGASGTTFRIVKIFYGSNVDQVTQIKRRNFLDAMKLVFANQPELLKKILDKEYEYDDMESIVNYYNGMKLEEARKKNANNSTGK
ncbi:MAG: hypothetical protein ACTHJ8_07855 [Mucilaginibacter sp.]